jgi:aspartate racemase
VKRIGLLGGMSWESSAEYYRLVNEHVREHLGALHSCDCLLRSLDFAQVQSLQASGDWVGAGSLLAEEARLLAAAGAELLVLCTNTMHIVAEEIANAVEIPFVHIADATAEAVSAAGHSTVGLLATRYTMEQEFYVGRLERLHGLKVLVPLEPERERIHAIIYDELCRGIIEETSRTEARAIIGRLGAEGAEAIILGCTELGLLIRPGDSSLPLIDGTRVHAVRAVELALAGGEQAQPPRR